MVQRKKPSSSHRRRASHAAPTLRTQSARIATDLRELGHIAVAGAGEALDTVKGRGLEALDHGRERYLEARDKIAHYVATNPFRSLLLAAGVGLLVGYCRGSRG